MPRELSNEEWDVLAQLHSHPGWGVFVGLLNDRIGDLIGDLGAMPIQGEEKVYSTYLRWRSLMEVRNELVGLPEEAHKNRFSYSVE